jgi:hypothetical protein
LARRIAGHALTLCPMPTVVPALSHQSTVPLPE